MFKNEIVFTQSHPLSKKERKEICSTLIFNFDKEIIEYISTNVKALTIQKGNILNHKRNVVFNELNPILFEYDAKVYYPTVYLLQMCNFGIGRNIINKVALIYEATVEYIESGADLMLKGVLNRNEIKQSSFAFNDLFYVQTDTGKTVGIGLSLVSKQLMNIDNPSGKFLKMIHRIGDSLWSLGNKKEQILLPINSIIEEVKNKAKILNQLSEVSEKPNENNKTEDVETKNEEEGNIKDEKEDKKIRRDEHRENEGNDSEVNVKINDDIPFISNEEKETTEDIIGESNTEDEHEHEKEHEEEEKRNIIISNESKEDIDNNLDIVFLTLCKLHLPNEKFPIDPGKLLKDLMKPVAIQLNLNIDLKQSSHKKINNYLKFIQKEKSLITFSKAKGQTNDYLQSVNWNNSLIKDFKPQIKKVKLVTQQQDINQHENILLSKDEKITVAELYKPNEKLKPLFYLHIPNFKEKDYYPLKECTEVLTKYMQSRSLFILTSEGMVHLDKTLEEKLSVHHTDFSMNEREYKMEEVLEMWKRNLNKKSCILKSSTTDDHQIEEVFYSKEVTIRIVAKKIQNKNVTLIEGLEKFVEIKDVTKALAKQFATSVTIKDIQGIKNAVFIQGYWVNELVNILTDEFKLKKGLIKVEDRLKMKKK